MGDFLAGSRLGALAEEFAYGSAKYEVDALARVDGVDVGARGFGIGDEVEDVGDEGADVALEPGAAQHLDEDHVGLKTGAIGLIRFFFPSFTEF